MKDDLLEEDPSEEDPSEADPFEENPPEDDLGDTGTLPSKFRPDDSPDDDCEGPEARGRYAISRWPPGCDRDPHDGLTEDALSRGG